MPMQQKPNNRRGEERSETLIIPHITKDMLEKARQMAAQGASRAEIEQAIAAMQRQKSAQTAQPAPKSSIVQPAKPAAPERNAIAHNNTIITPTSRPRYSPAERRAMFEEVQRRQAEREAARQQEARVEEERYKTERRADASRTLSAAEAAQRALGGAARPQPVQRPAQPAVDATRTIQVPRRDLAAAARQQAAATQPAVEPTQVLPKTAPAPQPAHTAQAEPAPQPAAAPAPKAKSHTTHISHGTPRNYAEAEAALNERIRADHIWLSNPVLVRGLGLAPVVGAALDGKRALMLCVAALILVTFTRVLAVAVCHLTKNRFRPVVYCYSAALLYIPTYILLYRLFGTDLALLGIYLPILVVEPAIVKRMEFSELEPVKDAFRHGFNNALGMCVVLLIVGCLRELLATGAVFGNVILHSALLPLAALPAGGFVIVGILAAIWCAVANLYTDYKHEEVRRLYADRKR